MPEPSTDLIQSPSVSNNVDKYDLLRQVMGQVGDLDTARAMMRHPNLTDPQAYDIVRQRVDALEGGIPGTRGRAWKEIADRTTDVASGLGLAALSAGEGFMGRPLTAMKLQEIGVDREKVAEEKRRHDVQLMLERHKQFRQDTKDALEYAKGELASIRTFKDAAEAGDATAIQHLRESRAQSEHFYPGAGGAVWDRMYKQPDATAGMLDALAQGHYDMTFGRASSLGQIGKPLLDIMGNDKLMALNELRYIHDKGKPDAAAETVTVKDKGYSRTYTKQEIDDLRKRGGMQTSAEALKTSAEARTEEAKAREAVVQEPIKTEKLNTDMLAAKRDLGEKDLKEYTTILDRAIKLAGGGGLSFEMGEGGTLQSFSMGDMSKLDTKKLVAHLRNLAKTSPGISDRTRVALHNFAHDTEAGMTKPAGGPTNPDLKSLLEEEKRKAGIK